MTQRQTTPHLPRHTTVLTLLLAALTIAGCKTREASIDRGTKFGEPDKLPEVKTVDRFEAFSALGYQPQWVGYAVVPSGRRVLFADAYGDTVLIHTTANTLTGMDASNGTNRWTQDMGGDLERFVGNVRRDDGAVICCSESEVFVIDAPTGTLKERQKLDVIANTKPVLFGNMAVFGCTNGEVLGHNLKTGFKQWGYSLKGSITAPPADVGGRAAAVSQEGEFVILDPRTGASTNRGSVYGGSAYAPAASDTSVFIASLDQSLWAFDHYKRGELWRYRTEHPFREQAVHHAGSVYVAVGGEGLSAFDASSGDKLWTLAGQGGRVIAVRKDRLIVWDGKTATSVDAARGDAVERVALPETAHLFADELVDGNIYAVSARGQVAKFSPKK